jgi:hypothetical protein
MSSFKLMLPYFRNTGICLELKRSTLFVFGNEKPILITSENVNPVFYVKQ